MINERADLSALEGETFDLAVVGGGIMGTGIARDASLRGLRVLLVEKEDFGSGLLVSYTVAYATLRIWTSR